MSSHPYVRAYLAGIFIPTLVLPLVLVALITVGLVLGAGLPIHRALAFPLALVPLLWGLWNMLWVASRAHTHLAVGPHGALLPFLLMPAGAFTAHSLGVLAMQTNSVIWFGAIEIPYAWLACGFVIALIGYYLVWKYIVGYINAVLGIA